MNTQALRIILAAAIGAAVMATVSAAWPASVKIKSPKDSAAVAMITEDDPRWNCAVMGNRVCGPVDFGAEINRCEAVYQFLVLQCEEATDGAHIPVSLCLRLAGFCASVGDNGHE